MKFLKLKRKEKEKESWPGKIRPRGNSIGSIRVIQMGHARDAYLKIDITSQVRFRRRIANFNFNFNFITSIT